jgi:phosphatidylserine/phosphatidylglycerophosphate/cardiolipin synthase-like enzyme
LRTVDSSKTYGAVALDSRVAEGLDAAVAASHHQKFLIIRSGGINRAYLGGVDLAFTRRDAPPGNGDWQSGSQLPSIRYGWPRQQGMNYSTVDSLIKPDKHVDPNTDLPATDKASGGGTYTIYGDTNQLWHDRHLAIDGPFVQTLDSHFRERWNDAAGRTAAFSFAAMTSSQAGQLNAACALDVRCKEGDVIFSSDDAMVPNPLPAQPPFTPSTVPMPAPPAGQPPPSGGQSTAQMWRTVQIRKTRTGQDYFQRGEFTVVDGLVSAITRSTELIWIFEQYFWSQPVARILNAQLQKVSSLYVILVLPPHADGAKADDSKARAQHNARYLALSQLVDNVRSRVGVYSMWQPSSTGSGRGIYVHAKSHIYDGTLLVTGSANMNRRSLIGDSELMCAVVDQPMTLGLMQALWTQLFPGSSATGTASSTYPFPIDTSSSGWGARFFASFAAAAAAEGAGGAKSSTALVYSDPPADKPGSAVLPSGASRNLLTDWNKAIDWYDHFLESSCLDYKRLEQGNADLATIRLRLNQYLNNPGEFGLPFRN